jgi:DNA-directed RNA polymerase specialized sigma24 family protein
MAVDRLDEPARSVVTLYGKGFTLRQIAVELKLEYWTVWRAWQAAIRQLGEWFQ